MKQATNTELGKFINRERKARNMTLDDLATAVDASRSYVWGLENGQHVPSLLSASRLAAALGVTVDELSDLLMEDEVYYGNMRSGRPKANVLRLRC